MSLRNFLLALERMRLPNVFNPWASADALDVSAVTAAADRRARLRAHFRCRPQLILIGEAAGYQGCHFSGIPFTSERLLLASAVPRVSVRGRLSLRPRPWSEPSATTIWNALHGLGIADRVVLWNAFAWHPHKPGQPLSNRTPTRVELEAGRSVLEGFISAFPRVPLFAVGQVADRSLRSVGVVPHALLRHPSMGGATRFREQLAAAVRARRMQ